MIATRLPTVMSHRAPITRHYQVDGGHLAVTVNKFLTATGTDVYFCDEQGVSPILQAIASYPDGTTHTQALEALGYTVVDDIGDEPEPETETVTVVEQSVFDILPPEIAAVLEGGS